MVNESVNLLSQQSHHTATLRMQMRQFDEEIRIMQQQIQERHLLLDKKFRNSWHPWNSDTTTLHRLPLLLLTENLRSMRFTHDLRSSNISLKNTAILRNPNLTGTIVSDDRPRRTLEQLHIFPTTTALLPDKYQTATNQQHHQRSFSARFHD